MQRHTSMACSGRSGPTSSSTRSAFGTGCGSPSGVSSAGGAPVTDALSRYLTNTVSLPRLPRLWNSTLSAICCMRKLPRPAPVWLSRAAPGSYSGVSEGS